MCSFVGGSGTDSVLHSRQQLSTIGRLRKPLGAVVACGVASAGTCEVKGESEMDVPAESCVKELHSTLTRYNCEITYLYSAMLES
jgi:hypothetical protein